MDKKEDFFILFAYPLLNFAEERKSYSFGTIWKVST